MAETPQRLVDIAGTPRPVSLVPVGIWDAGLVNDRWRTDHDDPRSTGNGEATGERAPNAVWIAVDSVSLD